MGGAARGGGGQQISDSQRAVMNDGGGGGWLAAGRKTILLTMAGDVATSSSFRGDTGGEKVLITIGSAGPTAAAAGIQLDGSEFKLRCRRGGSRELCRAPHFSISSVVTRIKAPVSNGTGVGKNDSQKKHSETERWRTCKKKKR